MTKVAILGGGGHAKVVINCLKLDPNVSISGIYDLDTQKKGLKVLGVPIVGHEDEVFALNPNDLLLVNGLGTIEATSQRHDLYTKFKNAGFHFHSVVHPSAVVAEDVVLEEGVQVMASVTIQPGTVVGENTILNTSCSIDHDCTIKRSCHIAPGVTLSGHVEVGEESHIGTGANVIQGITIGDHCTVAAGSTVVKNVANRAKVKGVPAR